MNLAGQVPVASIDFGLKDVSDLLSRVGLEQKLAVSHGNCRMLLLERQVDLIGNSDDTGVSALELAAAKDSLYQCREALL